MVGTSRRR